MSETELVIKSDINGQFNILKSDELVIGGYASIEMVDKQNDLITLEALNEAVTKFMEDSKYRNVMSNHSNVQVGEVINKYRDKHGMLHKTQVDDVGFYVVIKMRDDIEKAREIARNIRKGSLRSFSIGGQALSKKKKTNDEFGEYNEIDKLELHEVTVCEKGINPEAKFDILKEEKKGEKEMSEKLEKALEELNDLMKQVNELQTGDDLIIKDEDDADLAELTVETMDTSEEREEDELELADYDMDDDEDDEEMKGAKQVDGTEIETGLPEVAGLAGRKHDQLSKGWENSEFSTLDLSNENIEKAYAQYRAEQLEKVAYDKLNSTFANRFAGEQKVRVSNVEKQNYDAKTEVATLREEFAELRKSLTDQSDTIVKSQEFAIPEDVPSNIEQFVDMSWGDIHNIASKYGE